MAGVLIVGLAVRYRSQPCPRSQSQAHRGHWMGLVSSGSHRGTKDLGWKSSSSATEQQLACTARGAAKGHRIRLSADLTPMLQASRCGQSFRAGTPQLPLLGKANDSDPSSHHELLHSKPSLRRMRPPTSCLGLADLIPAAVPPVLTASSMITTSGSHGKPWP